MNTSKCLIILAVLLVTGHGAWAGDHPKAVMMPIAAPFSQEESARLADGIAERLSSRYQVLYGKEVAGVVKQIFDEENKGLNCDLDICYQKIARHFGVELIVAFVMTKAGEDGMNLSLSVLNVLENKVVLKRRAVCKSSRFDDLLKAGIALAKDGGS